MVFSIFNFKELKIKLIDPIRNWWFFTHTYTQRTKINNGLYLVKLFPHEEPNISTIVLKHDNSSFDFSFASESEGTKRFLLLVNLLLINNDDLIFAMDEIDRSWHPKLTQRFLELFMKANQDKRILLLCSTYENFILSDDFFL